MQKIISSAKGATVAVVAAVAVAAVTVLAAVATVPAISIVAFPFALPFATRWLPIASIGIVARALLLKVRARQTRDRAKAVKLLAHGNAVEAVARALAARNLERGDLFDLSLAAGLALPVVPEDQGLLQQVANISLIALWQRVRVTL